MLKPPAKSMAVFYAKEELTSNHHHHVEKERPIYIV